MEGLIGRKGDDEIGIGYLKTIAMELRDEILEQRQNT